MPPNWDHLPRRWGRLLAITLILAAHTAAAAAHPHHRNQHRHGCHTRACDRRVGRAWARTHKPKVRLGAHYTVSSTCYAQGGTTASGEQAYFGEVANNFLPLGTRIRLDRPEFGRTDFVVLDHIGSGSELDIFDPSEAACLNYGRRTIGFRVVL